MAKDKGAEEAQPEKKKLNLKKLIVPVLITLNMAGVITGAYLAYLGTIGTDETSMTEEKSLKEIIAEKKLFKDNPIIFTMEPFTVNLSEYASRIVQVEMNIEMLDEEGFEELRSKKAHARDLIVRILNAKNHEDLESIQGKLFLKDEISIALNKQLDRGIVKDIFFSRFVLQ